MGNKEYLFDDRTKAVECTDTKLATLKDLDFNVLGTERKEEEPGKEKKLKVTEIRMILKTDEKIIAVKMPYEFLEDIEIKTKTFYDRYAKFL